jgi:hypothetical protein
MAEMMQMNNMMMMQNSKGNKLGPTGEIVLMSIMIALICLLICCWIAQCIRRCDRSQRRRRTAPDPAREAQEWEQTIITLEEQGVPHLQVVKDEMI